MAAGTASLVLPALAAALLLALYRRQRRGKLPHPALRDTNWVREHGGEAQPAASGGLALSLVPAQAVPQSGGHASGTSSSQAVEASVRERARAHLKFGNLCARSGKLERALKHYSSAAAVDPTFAAPRYNCAGVCQRLKRFTEAVEHYEAALALKPGSIEAATNVVVAHLNAGQQLSPSGHPDQSLSHYRAAADKCHRALRVQAAAFDAGSRPDIGRFNSEAFANLNIALRLCGQQKQAVERTWRQLKELSRADEPGAAGARVSCPSAAGRSSAGASAAGLLAAGLSALGLATAAVSDAPPGSARPPLVELPPLDGCIVPAEDEIEIDCGPNRRTASACSPGPATAGGTLCRGAAGACAPSVLTVVCVKWGSKYGPEYVNRLYAMVDRHLARPITKATSLAGHQGRSVERTTSLAGEGGGEGRATDTQRSTDAHSSSAAREGGKSGPCFRFACLTDDPIGLRPEVEVLPVPVSAAGWQGWWLKACLFSDGCPINGRVLYLDLDTVIVGAIDPLLRYTGGFATLSASTFHAEEGVTEGYNSSIMLWDAGGGTEASRRLRALHDALSVHVLRCLMRWDHWVEMVVPNAHLIQQAFPGLVADFSRDCAGGEPPLGTAIVCFPRTPKPHQAQVAWVHRHWQE